MTTALYRISSNEVVKISLRDQQFADRDANIWAVLTDPTTPDGTDVRDTTINPPGPLRVLGLAKIAEPGTNNVRNATQPEIDTFAPAELDDENQQDADRATFLADDDPQFRKLMIAFADIVKDEINILRASAFGGLYRDVAVTAQSLPNNVFTKLDALTGSTATIVGNGVVADTVAGEIILPTAGTWEISWHLSFSGDNNTQLAFAAFGNGNEVVGSRSVRELGTGGAAGIGNVSGRTYADAPIPGIAVDLRGLHAESTARDITVETFQLLVWELTDRTPRTLAQLRNNLRNRISKDD